MKVLIVCSGNAEQFSLEKDQAFIFDQIRSIEKLNQNIQFNVFALKGKGIGGYLKQLKILNEEISTFSPDLIHAHGGHVGLLCVLQRKVPVVVTFHGSDINIGSNKWISMLASVLSGYSIFVSESLRKKMPFLVYKNAVIPCGVDRALFYPMDADKAKQLLGIDEHEKYFLFSSSFHNSVKNYPLAHAVTDHFPDYTLREIKNRKREEVNYLLNGAELLLMTSFSEGSPQIIKEALACNQKIVSVRVGDVEDQLEGVDACMVCDANEQKLVLSVGKVLKMNRSEKGRIASERFDSKMIAGQIIEIYNCMTKRISF